MYYQWPPIHFKCKISLRLDHMLGKGISFHRLHNWAFVYILAGRIYFLQYGWTKVFPVPFQYFTHCYWELCQTCKVQSKFKVLQQGQLRSISYDDIHLRIGTWLLQPSQWAINYSFNVHTGNYGLCNKLIDFNGTLSELCFR